MNIKTSMTLVLTSTLLMTACSFQKDPNKAPPVTPEPVKIGMTKEELQAEVFKVEGASFPDKLLFAITQEDEELFYKIIREAKDHELNDYSKTGETALLLVIRMGAPEVALSLLNKGASPYKGHKGTDYTPLQMINLNLEGYEDVKAVINPLSEKLFKEGLNSMEYGIASLVRFYNDTRFPLNKKMKDGKSLLDYLGKSGARMLAKSNMSLACSGTYVTFLQAVEKLEGPLSLPWSDLLELARDVKSPDLLKYTLSKMEGYKSDEIFKIVQSSSIEWIVRSSWILEKNKADIEEILIKNINNSTDKVLKNDLSNCTTLKTLEKDFPKAFQALSQKIDIESLNIYEGACLPGGKRENWMDLYNAILDGSGNELKNCD